MWKQCKIYVIFELKYMPLSNHKYSNNCLHHLLYIVFFLNNNTNYLFLLFIILFTVININKKCPHPHPKIIYIYIMYTFVYSEFKIKLWGHVNNIFVCFRKLYFVGKNKNFPTSWLWLFLFSRISLNLII